MRYLILFSLIFLTYVTGQACELPNAQIKIKVTKDSENVDGYMPNLYMSTVMSKLSARFNIVYEDDPEAIEIYVKEMDSSSFPYQYKSVYTITNPLSKESVTHTTHVSSDCITPTNWCVDEWRPKYIQSTADDITNLIKRSECTTFQSVFDLQLTREKNARQQSAQQSAIAIEKEQKRRVALKKLADEGNYKKLAKVISIKPKYYNLLDDKAKVMLMGSSSYPLWQIAEDLMSAQDEQSIMNKINGSQLKYRKFFSVSERSYLQEAGLSSRLIEFLQLHTQEVVLKQEEEARLARLERERQRALQEAKEAREEELAQARRARKREESKSNDEIWGKALAIGMGAVIANSSSLDSASKAEFLTKYSTDVMNNDMSMSNTKQWKDEIVHRSNTIQNQKDNSSISEADRNKKISVECKQKAKVYNDGNGQTTPHCQHAIYDQCIADALCSYYPDKCRALNDRVATSCEILSKMGDTQCSACN